MDRGQIWVFFSWLPLLWATNIDAEQEIEERKKERNLPLPPLPWAFISRETQLTWVSQWWRVINKCIGLIIKDSLNEDRYYPLKAWWFHRPDLNSDVVVIPGLFASLVVRTVSLHIFITFLFHFLSCLFLHFTIKWKDTHSQVGKSKTCECAVKKRNRLPPAAMPQTSFQNELWTHDNTNKNGSKAIVELYFSQFSLQAFEQSLVGALSYSAQHEPPTRKHTEPFCKRKKKKDQHKFKLFPVFFFFQKQRNLSVVRGGLFVLFVIFKQNVSLRSLARLNS